MDEEFDLDPEDILELGETFESIIKDSEEGYVVELHMTRLAAKELIKQWLKALSGDEESVMESLGHYAYMISEIMYAVKEDESNES
jgi:hypothetical protein